MQELKDFIRYALKNPALWAAFIVWFTVNFQWLVPSIPENVLNSAVNLLTAISIAVVAYLAGKDAEKKAMQRSLARVLPQQESGRGGILPVRSGTIPAVSVTTSKEAPPNA